MPALYREEYLSGGKSQCEHLVLGVCPRVFDSTDQHDGGDGETRSEKKEPDHRVPQRPLAFPKVGRDGGSD